MKLSCLDVSGGLTYRGEGNANLVLAITGTSAVLRFVHYMVTFKLHKQRFPLQVAQE